MNYQELTKQELELYERKNKDYTKGGDPYGNFNRVSAIKRLYPKMDWASPIGTCLDYMLKQVDSAFWMLSQGYEGEIETVDNRLMDVHIYAKIARLLER